MLTRRDLLLTSAAAFAASGVFDAPVLEAAGGMSLSLHQNTSSRAGFRGSLEGWAKAGITHVELTSNLLDQFLKDESLGAAKRLLADLNLRPVSGACGVAGLLEANPDRAAAIESFKKRCEMWAELAIPLIYTTTQSSARPS